MGAESHTGGVNKLRGRHWFLAKGFRRTVLWVDQSERIGQVPTVSGKEGSEVGHQGRTSGVIKDQKTKS